MAGIAIPSDILAAYNMFVVTETLRFVSFSLRLKADDLPIYDAPEKPSTQTELSHLYPDASAPANPSLLSADPFSIPAVLTRPQGFPVIAKLSLPASHSIKDEIRVTPETLRYLATVTQRIEGEICEVQVAMGTVKIRTDLCIKEFERQRQRAAEVAERAKQLIQTRRPLLLDRINNVQNVHTQLVKRMNRLLETQIKKASPDLNEHETRWFEELKRMKAQVLGVGRYDSDSMKMRTRKVCKEYYPGIENYS